MVSSKSKNDPRTRCFVIKNGKVLVMIREFPNGHRTLLLPGGGIDAHESSVTAVKREIQEELTLDVSSDPVYYHTFIQERNIFPDERSYIKGYDKITDIFDFFYYKLKAFEIPTIAQEEHEKWLTWGFVNIEDISRYAKKYNADVGIGVLSAAQVLSTRQSVWR